jgi:hypothetical protein
VITNPGYYKVEIDHPLCNSFVKNFRVIDDPLLIPQIADVPIICSEQLVQLQAEPANGTWSAPVDVNGIVDAEFLDNGAYPIRYTVETEHGCEYFIDKTIQVDKISMPTITQD